MWVVVFFFFSSRRRHTRCYRDWSSDVCSSDLIVLRDYVRARLGNEKAGELMPRRLAFRSGERRGGEEGRSRWSPDHLKKKKKKKPKQGGLQLPTELVAAGHDAVRLG